MIHLRSRRNMLLGLCGLMFLTAVGCDVQVGSWSCGNQEKSERTMELQSSVTAGGTLDVDTGSGFITITGADVSDCSVTAEIVARAPSVEEAMELAEQVEIQLQQAGDTLSVRAEKPDLKGNRSISVSYTITLPRQMNVVCKSSYGNLNVDNIVGTVTGKTSSGSIEGRHIVGRTELRTSYGSVKVSDITAPGVTLYSSSGSIDARRIQGTAQIESSYGSVTCEDFSDGDLTLKSGSGRISINSATFGTCNAKTSYGSVSCNIAKGRSITLRSSSGSIDIADGTADIMDISTSYGRVTARRITTSRITAHSGSGNVDVDCSPACPAEIVAEVKSSYGSVDVTAPPSFSGQVHLSTSYGEVTTDLPVTVSGKISKKKLDGTVGDGDGRLHLQTSSGSIHLH